MGARTQVRAMVDTVIPTHACRKSQIERFSRRQRDTRDWINFADIADFCAREGGSIVPDEKKRVVAFETLAKGVLNREFERNGRSQVLFLNYFTKKARLTCEELMEIIQHNYDGDAGRSGYLPCCWAPRGIIERWFEKHRVSKPAGWFTAQHGDGPRTVRQPNERAPTALYVRLAEDLCAMFPKGRPNMKVKEIAARLAGNPNSGKFDMRTVERALSYLGWTNDGRRLLPTKSARRK
jgi:hypothetical protein